MRGSIEKHGKNYRVTIFIGYAKTDDEGQRGKILRHRATCSTKKAAEKYLRDKILELETEGSIRERSLETFAAYLRRWLEVCGKQKVRTRTFEDYSAAVERFFGEKRLGYQLGQKPLPMVTSVDIQELYNKIGTPHGVRKIHAVIRQALEQGVRWRELVQNPALHVDLPRMKKAKLRLISLEDFPAFARSALAEPRLGAMWLLALSTGMRPEEYMGLRWADLAVNYRKLTIHQVLVRRAKVVKGEPTWWFDEPKTPKSQRTLALDSEVSFLLKQHRAEQAAERLAAGEAYQDHDLVFATELGEPLRLDNLRNRNLQRIVERAGLTIKGGKLTLYSLRHSAATSLLKDRESLKVVSELLGHSTIRLTGDIYSHVTDDMLEEASAKLGRRIFGR